VSSLATAACGLRLGGFSPLDVLLSSACKLVGASSSHGFGSWRLVTTPSSSCHQPVDPPRPVSAIPSLFHPLPVLAEYCPDLVIISAGFDAAEGDPIGGCHLTPE
jgi:hypothetical protein